jgi:hypothetical protein
MAGLLPGLPAVVASLRLSHTSSIPGSAADAARTVTKPLASVSSELAGPCRDDERLVVEGERLRRPARPGLSLNAAHSGRPDVCQILGFVGLRFRDVGTCVDDPLIDNGQEALDVSAGQLVQGNVRPLVGRGSYLAEKACSYEQYPSGPFANMASWMLTDTT